MLPRTSLAGVLSWLALLSVAYSLKFDLNAHSGSSGKYQRCIRNFVSRETLVVVTATISGSKGDGQVVNMLVSNPPSVGASAADACSQIKDTQDNEYGKPKDVVGETRLAFTSHTDSAFDVCFENILTGRRKQARAFRSNKAKRFPRPCPKPLTPCGARHRHWGGCKRLVSGSSSRKTEARGDGAPAYRGDGR